MLQQSRVSDLLPYGLLMMMLCLPYWAAGVDIISVCASYMCLTDFGLQYKVCSWIAIIFCAQSLANMKNFENDLKQLSMAFM